MSDSVDTIVVLDAKIAVLPKCTLRRYARHLRDALARLVTIDGYWPQPELVHAEVVAALAEKNTAWLHNLTLSARERFSLLTSLVLVGGD